MSPEGASPCFAKAAYPPERTALRSRKWADGAVWLNPAISAAPYDFANQRAYDFLRTGWPFWNI